jgi:DNA-binding response OmpR family regulator
MSMPNSRTILIVEHNSRNTDLITEFFRSDGYEVMSAPTVEELDRLLKTPEMIGLALIDLVGFDHRIWERSEILRTKEIPFILISARKTSTLGRGERLVLFKPLIVKEMLALVGTILKEAVDA